MKWPWTHGYELLELQLELSNKTLEDASRRIRELETQPPPVSDTTETDQRLEHFEIEIEQLQRKITELVHAISEGIERTERSERRIKASVRRARKELAEVGLEDPTLEAEVAELQLLDGGGGEGLSPVQPELEDDDEHPSSIRGVSRDQLMKARGWQ
jgi:predicted  nucleic acid-binding Zn-ribbon protein